MNTQKAKTPQDAAQKAVISKNQDSLKNPMAQNPAQIFKKHPELAKIIARWEHLPEPKRKAILSLAGLSAPENSKP